MSATIPHLSDRLQLDEIKIELGREEKNYFT